MMDTLSRLQAGELAGTTRLELHCGLVGFPREILDLADTLEILDLSGNGLSGLPEDFDRLHRLRIFFCSENDFRHLPAVLGRCPALEMIGFKANRIETADGEAFPPKLRWLILTDNRLGALPGTIGRCGRLQKLMLAGNQLEELPVEMAACRSLELIRLSANRFRSFPAWLFELPRLSWLALAGNPGDVVPELEAIREIPWADLGVDGFLGEGASGVIHRARWQAGDRPVAVKVFKGCMTSDGLPELEMAVSMAAGNHPNLIGVLGKVSDHPDGGNGLVMPLIDPGFVNLAGPPDFDSCTRDCYAEDLRFTPGSILKMAVALASVARHLHGRGIAHGDFYAHNILWNGDGECLLGDFGAASFHPPDADLERIEVRAFGCLLEELLNRGNFAGGDAETVAGLRELQVRCIAEEVRTRPDFEELRKCLELMRFPMSIPDRSRRFHS